MPISHDVMTDSVQKIDEASLVLGKLAVKHNLVQPEDVKKALSLQLESIKKGKKVHLGQILIQMGLLQQKQLDFLLSFQKMVQERKLDRDFGERAVSLGHVDAEQVEKALAEQARIFKEGQELRLIGEILVEWGQLDPARRDALLEKQQRTPPKAEKPAAAETTAEPSKPEEVKSPPEVPTNDEAKFEDIIHVSVKPDGMEAYVTPSRPIPDSLTVDDLKVLLREKGVLHGLMSDEELEDYLRNGARSGSPHVVAVGTPPKPGTDAAVRCCFDADPLKVGTIREGGNIDFRDKGDVSQVKSGTLLAERTPPREGTPGTSVSGKPVPPPKPKNAKIKKGKGTRLSPDGSQLFAEIAGRPEMSADGKIYVFSEHKISGDVDLKTGHVFFGGGIEVAGTIKSGFKVKGGSLKANEIVGAEIDIRGDVVVTGGIIGARISLGGSLRARFIHKTEIEVFGDVVVDKEVIDSDIEGSGAFIVKNGPVLSSEIVAKKGIEVMHVGSKTSNPCHLSIGTDDRAENEISKIEALIDKYNKSKEALLEKIRQIESEALENSMKLGEIAQMQDKTTVKKRELEQKLPSLKGDEETYQKIEQIVRALQEEIKEREAVLEKFFTKEDELDEKTQEHKNKIEELDKHVEALDQKIKSIRDWADGQEAIPVLKVHGKLFPFAEIKGPNTFLTVPNAHERVQIKEVESGGEGESKEWALKISPLK